VCAWWLFGCVVVVVMRKSTGACGVWVWVSGNNIGEEGAKALGPHLAKLVNMTELYLKGRKRGWDVCMCVRGGCFVVVKSTCACGVWVWVSDNNIGEEGAKALGPHLAKLVNMNKLWLTGRKRGWDVCMCVRGGCLVVLLWL